MLPRMFSEERTCWACLQPGTQLRVDRKGKPYLACPLCGTYVFFRTRQALAGLALVSPVVEEIARRMQADPHYAAEQQQLVARSRAALFDAMSLPLSPAARSENAVVGETKKRTA